MRRGLVGLTLVGGLTALASPAAADQNDLVLSRLATPVMDGSGNVTGFVGQNLELRSLSSQLGTVLAPHLLTPADTLGFGGFQLTVDYAVTQIDAGQSYWRVRNGGTDDSMRTVGLFMRKGTWFPLLSFELGGGAIHLVDSRIWTGQFYTKFALHEGYHQLPIPSLAVRGAVSRMMTQRELDLTVASVDVTVSKHFGIGGTWRFDPFVGWNVLMIIPRSEVIDPTPEVDPLVMGNEQDILLNFVFKDQDNILRHRLFLGAKFQYYVFQFTVEAQFALAGSSKDDRGGTNDECMPNSATTNCDATDTAATQRTLSLSAGFDF
jgi:hypothetical protein